MKLDKQDPVPMVPQDRQSPPGHSVSVLQQLSPLRITSMTHLELVEILPKLKLAVQEEELSRRRPDWWPHSVPWTQHYGSSTYKTISLSSLRRVVQLCYSHLSQHALQLSPAAPPRVLDWLNSHPPSRTCTQLAKAVLVTSSPKHKGGSFPYLEIYLCYLCGEEFVSKDTLQKHQVQCCGTLSLSIPSTPPASEAPSPGPPTIASDDTSSSGGMTAITSLPSSCVSSVMFHDFVAALDLVPVFRARKIRQAQRRNTECETIDLEEPQTPISPCTPRTPKLLISQLSRDASSGGAVGEGSSSRRRLSYLRQSSEKKEKPAGGESDSESDSESCSTSSDDTDDPKVRKKSLLSIDLTSGLGQRVMKHITSEAHVPVISDVEQYCRTPIKDKYQDRLRARQLCYPITYKLTRKRLRQQQFYHVYKFTHEQKQEFVEKMRTGLNKECRELLKVVKKCSVVVKRLSRKTLLKWKPSLNRITVSLKHLTPEEIFYWTRPKPPTPVDVSPSVFPTGPTFLLPDIDRVLGLKRKDCESQSSCKLLAGHFLSEATNAELQLQKLTVYRSLLTDLSSSGGGADEGGLTGSDHQDDSCRTRNTGKAVSTGQYGEKFPSLFSILSSGVPAKKMARGKPAMGQLLKKQDFKQPLQIEIPSPSTGPQPVSLASVRSPADDAFSIRTNNSSDEECNKCGVCCSMCAVRSRCVCSPHKDGTVLSRSLRSKQAREASAPSPQLTPSPPQLLSCGLPTKLPVSSQQVLSPPVLSPVSHLSSSVSPVWSPRLTRASASHSPVPSPMSLLSSRSSAPSPSSHLSPESPVPHCKRQMDCAEPMNSRPSQDQGDGAKRPNTRSNPTENACEWAPGQQKCLSTPCDSVCETDGRSVTDVSRLACPGAMPLADVRFTRSGKVIGEMSANSPGVADTPPGNHLQKGVTVCGSRSGSRSCERSSNIDENGVMDSVEGAGPMRILRSGSSVSSLSTKSDKSTSGISVSSKSVDGGSRVGTRTNARGRMFHISSRQAVVRNSDNSTGVTKEMSSCQIRGQAETSGVRSKSESSLMMPLQVKPADSSHIVPSLGIGGQESNPFLLSKAQTALFSSNIREQARRRWHVSHKSPDHASDSKAVLRSGNSFRTGGSCSPVSPVTAKHIKLDAWHPGAVKLEPGLSPSGLNSPTLSEGRKKGPSYSSQHTPPHPSQSASPARKRLSPLQMLSVLESTKKRHATGKSAASGGKQKSPVKGQKQKGPADVTGKRPIYQPRAKDTGSPVKKMRLSQQGE